MFSTLISFALSNLLYLALHVTNSGSFPKPLSAKEERACFEQMAEGDKEARSRLIEHNLRLVVYGTIGLIKAVSTFDYEKGTRFATYAARCIENEVLMHFRNQKKNAQDVYISDPIDTDKDGNTLTLLDIVSDEENLLDNIDIKLKAQKVYECIDRVLTPREKMIIEQRYGLYGYQALTQREVAHKLGISRSYVSRIEKKALEELRKLF